MNVLRLAARLCLGFAAVCFVVVLVALPIMFVGMGIAMLAGQTFAGPVPTEIATPALGFVFVWLGALIAGVFLQTAVEMMG